MRAWQKLGHLATHAIHRSAHEKGSKAVVEIASYLLKVFIYNVRASFNR